MWEQFQDMKEVVIIADDLVVFDKSQDEHDKYFQALLERCCTLEINLDKLEMGFDALTFIGHRITKEGFICLCLPPDRT